MVLNENTFWLQSDKVLFISFADICLRTSQTKDAFFFNFVAATIYATFTGRFQPILLELNLRSHSGSDSMFSRILFQFLSWRPHRRYLLTGEGLKGLCYEMRVWANHLLPAPRLHHVCHMTRVYELNRLKLCPESFRFTETNNKHTAVTSHQYLSL